MVLARTTNLTGVATVKLSTETEQTVLLKEAYFLHCLQQDAVGLSSFIISWSKRIRANDLK